MPTRPTRDDLRNLVRRTGFDVVRFRGDLTRHQTHLFRSKRIAVLADVGANEGQYASRMRLLGYRGPIVSFEPIPAAVSALRSRSAGDISWRVEEVAVGAAAARETFHVSGNSVSSSLLAMTDRHTDADPASAYVDDIEVEVRPLDDYLDELPGPVWLKLDVQGGELGVIAGATRVLERSEVVQAELSLTSLYEGGPSALEVITTLSQCGFRLADLERGFADRETGALLQADGLFVRS